MSKFKISLFEYQKEVKKMSLQKKYQIEISLGEVKTSFVCWKVVSLESGFLQIEFLQSELFSDVWYCHEK